MFAAQFNAGLKGLPFTVPAVATGNSHVYHVYAVLTDNRDACERYLAEHGVPTIIYYPKPLHLQKVYVDLGYREGDFPVSEAISRKILPLPIYPELSDEQAAYIVKTLREYSAAGH
jgi:dTDP-4-amino-4,6-dideoxygalactose transaminase